METKEVAAKPVDRLKIAISEKSVQDQFKNALAEAAPLFVASLIEVFTNDKDLQECKPAAVIMEALKAATLKLPINKQLGFAWIIARKDHGVVKPGFQMGYRGYVQLAMRTGQYRFLNAGILYEGMTWVADLLTGETKIQGQRESDTALAYFAHLELLNGFKKTVCWTRGEVIEHAKRYVPAWNNAKSAWKTNFDQMATKTVLTNLLDKWGILSVEMVMAMSADSDSRSFENDNPDNGPEPSPLSTIPPSAPLEPISAEDTAKSIAHMQSLLLIGDLSRYWNNRRSSIHHDEAALKAEDEAFIVRLNELKAMKRDKKQYVKPPEGCQFAAQGEAKREDCEKAMVDGKPCMPDCPEWQGAA